MHANSVPSTLEAIPSLCVAGMDFQGTVQKTSPSVPSSFVWAISWEGIY